MHADAFVSIVLVVLLTALTIFAWREAMTAWARQLIFEKRDALFDMASAGRLNFKSEEYRTIRASLEASIRFAHELTLTRMIVTRVAAQAIGHSKAESELVLAVRQIEDDETREEVSHLVYSAQRALISMIVLKSPLLMIAAFFVLAVSLCMHGVRRSLDGIVKRVGEVVQIEAESVPIYSRTSFRGD